MDIFKDVYLKSQVKEKFKRCDWADATDVAFYVQDMRSEERKRVLDELVPKRICPYCSNLKINSKSWVVSKDKKKAMCRGCFMRKVPDRKLVASSRVDLQIFTPQLRYRVDGHKIMLARSRADVSAYEFASHAGWASSYQYKLEDGTVRTVSAESAETILEVLARFGYYTKDEL